VALDVSTAQAVTLRRVSDLPKLGWVVFRRPGTLLPLERRMLEVGFAATSRGMYGLLLSQELAGGSGETRLVAHGTL
jgi:hypothetical protein